MQLYLVHCGFYDEEILGGIYEFHVNIPIAAPSLETAKEQVRLDAAFRRHRMHIDGIQEVKCVAGHRIELRPDASGSGASELPYHLHRDL